MKEKINQLISLPAQAGESIKPKLISLDLKFQGLVPNPKLRKILYYGIGGLFGFMLLLIFIGILLMPFRNQGSSSGFSLIKPKIELSSPVAKKELNDTQKKILGLENKIKDLKFPESILTVPEIKIDLKND